MNLNERISKELSNPANWRDSDRGPQFNPEAIKQLIREVVAEIVPERATRLENVTAFDIDEVAKRFGRNQAIAEIESNLKRLLQ